MSQTATARIRRDDPVACEPTVDERLALARICPTLVDPPEPDSQATEVPNADEERRREQAEADQEPRLREVPGVADEHHQDAEDEDGQDTWHEDARSDIGEDRPNSLMAVESSLERARKPITSKTRPPPSQAMAPTRCPRCNQVSSVICHLSNVWAWLGPANSS